jgi:vitamin-K-epoxide reductase (warfarin-sensitive)
MSILSTTVSVAAVLGICLATYALYVEHASTLDSGFKAACDIDWLGASCTKVFSSEYGRLGSHLGLLEAGSPLDLPNAAVGLVFYVAVLLLPYAPLSQFVKRWLLLVAAVMSAAASAYLGYALHLLGDFCVVCVSTYIVNAAILLASLADVCVTRSKTKEG